MVNATRMTLGEVKNTLILALIFALRLLGLFMVLPVMALYADKVADGTPALIGLAAGIYGLTQALCQLPFGILSDKYGRKPIIRLGLVIFSIGSLIASFSHSIWGLIIGRAIQGSGAIGSPVLALVADLTREQVRTQAMAIIGISIGLTFVLALLMGPLLDGIIGLSGIFMITAILSAGGILLLVGLKEEKAETAGSAEKENNISEGIKQVRSISLRDRWRVLSKHQHLWSLNMTVFVLHALLTASFLILPLKIEELLSYSSAQVWRFYLPVLVISLLIVLPFLRRADNKHWQMKLINIALISFGVSVITLMCTSSVSLFVVAVTLFFVAFNFLEASLPAWVSRIVPKESKGFAMGAYSCSQFLGMFCGGALGGYLHQWLGTLGLGMGCLLFVVLGALALKRVEYAQRGNSLVIQESQLTGEK